MSWTPSAAAQGVTASDAACAPDAELVKGWTRHDLCVCRVYQARAQAAAQKAEQADGLLRRAIDEGKAARQRADMCEGGAEQLRAQAAADRAALDGVRAAHALLVAREADRWSAWRGGALGVCVSGLGVGAAAWSADSSAGVVLGAVGLGAAGCVVTWLIK